eukprot:403338082
MTKQTSRSTSHMKENNQPLSFQNQVITRSTQNRIPLKDSTKVLSNLQQTQLCIVNSSKQAQSSKDQLKKDTKPQVTFRQPITQKEQIDTTTINQHDKRGQRVDEFEEIKQIYPSMLPFRIQLNLCDLNSSDCCDIQKVQETIILNDDSHSDGHNTNLITGSDQVSLVIRAFLSSLEEHKMEQKSMIESLEQRMSIISPETQQILKKKIDLTFIMSQEQYFYFKRLMKNSFSYIIYQNPLRELNEQHVPQQCCACQMFHSLHRQEKYHTCDSCNVMIHQSCLDTIKITDQEWMQIFHICGKGFQCEFCKRSNSTMRLVDKHNKNQVYCHEVCLFFYCKKSKYITERLQLPLRRLTLKGSSYCTACQSSLGSVFLNCAKSTCRVQIHPYCAYQNLYEFIFEATTSATNNNYTIKVHCKDHRTSKFMQSLSKCNQNKLPVLSEEEKESNQLKLAQKLLDSKSQVCIENFVIDRARTVYMRQKHFGIVTVSLKKQGKHYAVSDSLVVNPKNVNYDLLLDQRCFFKSAFNNTYGFKFEKMWEVFQKLKFNLSDSRFASHFYENRESFQVYKIMKRTLVSTDYKFLWRYLHWTQKKQVSDSNLKALKKNRVNSLYSMYCSCHRDSQQNLFITCRSNFFCRYAGKLHKHCLKDMNVSTSKQKQQETSLNYTTKELKKTSKSLQRLNSKTYKVLSDFGTFICKSCEQEELNTFRKTDDLMKFLNSHDFELISDAIVTSQICVGGKPIPFV